MPLNVDYLKNLEREPVIQTYDWRDAAIYALGLGYGSDPTDSGQLRFLDREQQMQAHPAMANVLAYDGAWLRDPASGIDYLRVVHGEQEMEIHHPLPPEGRVTARIRVEELVDKGAGRAALVTACREIRDAEDGTHYATVRNTAFCRGAGGFGGKSVQGRQPRAIPDRAPDGSMDIPTLPQLALIYRLSGDLNPLHSNPEIARKAGFDRPILHGLSTFGIACRALMAGVVGNEPRRVRKLAGRFSAPIYPGETLTIDWWRTEPGQAAFIARVGERRVLSDGCFAYHQNPGQ